MPRWEFHLSMDDSGTSARWAWMYRLAGGDAVTSKITFATYRDCIADALLHGYRAGDVGHYREPALGASS